MDPVTLIVTALALGAAAGLKDTTSQAIKDAYSGIKTLILRKYGDVGLEALEKKPESQAKRDSVFDDLIEAGAGQDEELMLQAKALVRLVEQYAPNTGADININLEDLKIAGSFRLADVGTEGTGATVDVTARRVETGSDFEITGVRAIDRQEPDSKN